MGTKLLVIFLLLFYIIIGCSQKVDIKPFDSNDIVDFEEEDNDLFKNPKDVSTQKPIIGFFNKKDDTGDKDYYKVFFSIKNTPYEILQTAVPGIDSKITFYSASKKLLFDIDRGGKGEPEKLWEYYPISNYVIISIKSKIGFNEKVPYVINFIPKINDDINEVEPNDSESNAINIKPGEEKKALISPESDVDYYKVIFDDDSFYDYSIKIESQSSLDINFSLINIDNNITKYINDFGWGDTESFPFLSNKKGDFFIKIKGNMKSGNLQNPDYTLKIEKNIEEKIKEEEINYEREFNDNSDIATEILDGITIIGIFYPENDEDWFKFDIIRRAVRLNISLSRIQGLNPNIELYDKNLNVVQIADNNSVGKSEDIIINNIKRGKYYIKISSDKKSLLIYKLFLHIRY